MTSLSPTMRRVLDDLHQGFTLEHRGKLDSLVRPPSPGIGDRAYTIKAQTAKALLDRDLLHEISRNSITVSYTAKPLPAPTSPQG